MSRGTRAAEGLAIVLRRDLAGVALGAARLDALARLLVEDVDLDLAHRRDRIELALLERLVERLDVLRDQVGELLVDVGELAAQRLDAVDLVLGRLALPADQRLV